MRIYGIEERYFEFDEFLLDTGSTYVVIPPVVNKSHLRLPIAGTTSVSTADGRVERPFVVSTAEIPGTDLRAEKVEILLYDMPEPKYLVGLSFLKRFRLTLDWVDSSGSLERIS